MSVCVLVSDHRLSHWHCSVAAALCCSDACNNPVTWWLGDYDGSRFDVAAADGPHRLDLGTTLYAATLWEDPQVGVVGGGEFYSAG